MFIQDSIIHAADTIGNLKADSIALLDSLSKADSVAKIDSAKIIATVQPSGMEGILLPSLPNTESWTFVVLIILFAMAVLGIMQSGSMFFERIRVFFGKKNRADSYLNFGNSNSVGYQLILSIFSIGVISLFGFEWLFMYAGDFKLIVFLKVLGFTTCFFLLKYLLTGLLGLIFFDIKAVRQYRDIYFNLISFISLCLFPVLTLYTYEPIVWHHALEVIAISIIVIFSILLIIKLIQNYYTKSLAGFYIFLYLCTLEILPVLLLIRAYQLVI